MPAIAIPIGIGLGEAAVWLAGALGVTVLGYGAAKGGEYLANQMSEADKAAEDKSSNDDANCVGDCNKSKERKNKDGDVIIDEERAEHILSGDKTGGGHRAGTGKPGKTEFPESWSDDKILDGVADVAQNGNVKGPAHRPGEFIKSGTVDGVDIDVVVKGDGGVRTAFPTGGSDVIRNPR